jgi:putative peptidoglycan lipid II flippase
MSSMLRTVLVLAPLQLVFRVSEALLPLLLASWFGRSEATDLNVLFAKGFLFTGALLTAVFQDSVFIPTLARTARERPTELGRFAGSVFARAMKLAVLIATCTAGVYLLWLARSGSAHAHVAAQLALGYALYVIASTARAFFVGFLHAQKDFASYPVASGLGMSVSLLLVYLLRARFGIVALPFCLALGETIAFASLWLRSRSYARLSVSSLEANALRQFSRLASLEAINPLVDQLVARQASVVGGGTLLGYAFDVASIPTSIAQAIFFSVFLAHLSEARAKADKLMFERTLRQSLRNVPLVIALVSALLWLVRGPLVRLMFMHQAMDRTGADVIIEIVPYALIGAAPFGALLLLARAHVALENTRIMLGMGLLNALLNAGLNVALFPWLGLGGIALSTSLMHALVAVVFYLKLKAPLSKLASSATAG